MSTISEEGGHQTDECRAAQLSGSQTVDRLTADVRAGGEGWEADICLRCHADWATRMEH